jgi:hypothetical protein
MLWDLAESNRGRRRSHSATIANAAALAKYIRCLAANLYESYSRFIRLLVASLIAKGPLENN